MESCKNCRWYDAEFDNSQAQMNDMIKNDNEEYHYCPMFMYPEHIKKEVFENKENCKLFFEAP